MTDRQVTESSIGLAGRLSHLPYGLGKAEDRGWQSTRNFTQKTPVFKELGPPQIWVSTAGATGVQSPGSSASSAWQTTRKQKRWLLKAHPEARLGNECIHEPLLSSHSSSHLGGVEQWGSPLFAIGELTDASEPQRVSGAPLIAIATGEANDVLRLAKPSVEEWQWGDDESVSLLVPDMKEDDESVLFREDAVGPIRRLKIVVDSKRYDPTRWVVVQRDAGTRVFQPEYGRALTSSGYTTAERSSRIAVNPLFFLPKDWTGGNQHSDASFNPGVRSKPPQLGLIDECGFWTIWDITHTKVKSSRKPKVSLNKCGHIEKGVLSYLPSRGTGVAQWHRILWVGCPGNASEESQAFDLEDDADLPDMQGSFPQLVRSSTLLLCSPNRVRLLDLIKNSFLPDLPFVREGGRDCILDVHETPQDTQYVFVLTTLKLFVVRVFSSPGENWGETRKQWTIVLSISHLRDGFGRTLKLVVAPGARSPEQVTCLVYLYSNSNTRADIFYVAMLKSDPSRVTYHSEAVVVDALQRASADTQVQAMCLYPLPITLKRSSTPTQSASHLSMQQVRLYRLAALRTDMCLVSTLCASTLTLPVDQINRPDRKVGRIMDLSRERKRVLKHLSSRFVVLDDVTMDSGEGDHPQAIVKRADALSRRLVIRRPIGLFYEHLSTVFGDKVKDYEEPAAVERFGSNPFDHVRRTAEQAVGTGTMPATTLLQMMENLRLPNNISLISTVWEVEIERLGHVNPSMILLSFDRPFNQITGPTTSLQELYSALVSMTAVAHLSEEAQGWIQEARSMVFREIACDVYLSLFGLVHRQVDSNESQHSLARDLDNMVIDSQQESVAGGSSRAQSEVSTANSKESTTETPQREDPAMVLLRSYTGTGKFVSGKRTELLDKWKVGANPEDYVFDLDRNKEVTPGMERRAKQLARMSRKRRRAETLLQLPKDQELRLPATQPAPEIRLHSQFSQPLAGFSQSQAMMSDPLQTMSQPMTGAFGRRDERPRKKAKKRKGGF
ncbi:hypothetical protein F4677DRAFT_428241 [Hypoxylon crocopeplum]|nr:hypothetical protein F4677DRAFT_428241 [Hypoxylon crocopeplum]